MSKMIEQLKQEALEDVDKQIVLDDLIYDVFNGLASEKNNEGIEEQLKFLDKHGMMDEVVEQFADCRLIKD